MLLTPQKTPVEEVKLPVVAVSGRPIKQPSRNCQANSCFKSLFRAGDAGQLWLFWAVQSNNRQATVKQILAVESRKELARYSGFRAGMISSLSRMLQRSYRKRPSDAMWRQVRPVPAVQTERSRTAAAFQPSTPGNHSRNCSIVAPSLRFSKRVDTGTRLPRNIQAPQSLSGCRSTAALLSQSVKS